MQCSSNCPNNNTEIAFYSKALQKQYNNMIYNEVIEHYCITTVVTVAYSVKQRDCV